VFGKECRHPPLTLLDRSLLLEATDQFAVLVLHTSTRVHNSRGRKRTISAQYIGPHYNNIIPVNPPPSRDFVGRCTCTWRGAIFGKGWPRFISWEYSCMTLKMQSRCCIVALLRRCVVAPLLRCCTMLFANGLGRGRRGHNAVGRRSSDAPQSQHQRPSAMAQHHNSTAA